MKKTYKITVAGVTRDLPVCPLDEHVSIAAFIIFGDAELTVACAEALNKIVPEHDIMITAEAKSLPLIHEMARQAGEERYVVARKSIKVYMTDPVSVSVKSITTADVQTLFIDSDDVEALKGKRVLIVDDVISTGASINAVEKLVNVAGGNIVGKAAILVEGDAAKRTDILSLGEIPLIYT